MLKKLGLLVAFQLMFWSIINSEASTKIPVPSEEPSASSPLSVFIPLSFSAILDKFGEDVSPEKLFPGRGEQQELSVIFGGATIDDATLFRLWLLGVPAARALFQMPFEDVIKDYKSPPLGTQGYLSLLRRIISNPDDFSPATYEVAVKYYLTAFTDYRFVHSLNEADFYKTAAAVLNDPRQSNEIKEWVMREKRIVGGKSLPFLEETDSNFTVARSQKEPCLHELNMKIILDDPLLEHPVSEKILSQDPFLEKLFSSNLFDFVSDPDIKMIIGRKLPSVFLVDTWQKVMDPKNLQRSFKMLSFCLLRLKPDRCVWAIQKQIDIMETIAAHFVLNNKDESQEEKYLGYTPETYLRYLKYEHPFEDAGLIRQSAFQYQMNKLMHTYEYAQAASTHIQEGRKAIEALIDEGLKSPFPAVRTWSVGQKIKALLLGISSSNKADGDLWEQYLGHYESKHPVLQANVKKWFQQFKALCDLEVL